MSVLDILVNELNEASTDGEWTRLNTEKYRIVDTENGRFRIKKEYGYDYSEDSTHNRAN